jgi:DNA-binding CsgD family transcriptional regulator
MTGRYHSCAEVLAQLEQEGFEDVPHWQRAVHTHRKIDEVCEASAAALARGLPGPPDEVLPDDEAIWRAIRVELAAFWMRDFETFASCFVQEPRFRFHGSTRSMGVTIREGWEEFAQAVRTDIAYDPDPNAYFAYRSEMTNRNLTISGDMAWCTFSGSFQTLGLDQFRGPGITHEIRIMERQAGQWRCALYGLESIDFGQTDAPLWEVDAKGRVLQQNPAADRYLVQADDVEIRAGRLRIRDHAADLKLAEAITALAGIEYSFLKWRSSRPVVIDPGYDLPRTVWWVIAEHGKLMVTYNDHPQLLARLQAAGKVFALSPAQNRLATALVEGLPLTDAARREAVSLGTAKTQLQRIFDKVGVRSQPALVRALLALT